ncbi:MAG: pol polyprotein, partial [Candidatus Nanopelagicaceae bacterium]
MSLVRGHSKRNKRQKIEHLRPVLFVQPLKGKEPASVNPKKRKRTPDANILRALLDSGAGGTLISADCVSSLRQTKDPKGSTEWSTPGGCFKTSKKVIYHFKLPELNINRIFKWDCYVVPGLGNHYDMILGRDFLEFIKLDILFSNQTVEYDERIIPFKPMDATVPDAFHIDDDPTLLDIHERMKKILDAKYEAADLNTVVSEQTQLSDDEKQKLHRLLSQYASLFDGTLGKYTGSPVVLRLKKDAEPYHARAFPIPRVHMETLKMEVDRLCKIGVLKRVNRSQWAAPTFIIPKKDKTVRFISDFRELNKRIHRVPYPIPHIQDMLLNLEGFAYATSLDLNMGYYHLELSQHSKELCTIVLPFGKFEYQRIPMGLCNSPDIFQEKMNELFEGFEFVRAYIDDVLCLTKGDFDDHLEKLERVFARLQRAGLKVNAKKSFFARSELEYLGYWITREGIKPVTSKVEAMLKIAEPKNRRELRSFIGVINYYRDMWLRRSHVLAPLARLTSNNTKWEWTEKEANAFKMAKKIMAKEALLAYPDFTKPFVIHTDASHYQLGGVISQDGKPIAFYSRKLKDAQTRYTTTERELLSIVETLKEYRNILLGHPLIVFTDHKNLVYKQFNTERVMRWRLIIEEFGPELRYIKGE